MIWKTTGTGRDYVVGEAWTQDWHVPAVRLPMAQQGEATIQVPMDEDTMEFPPWYPTGSQSTMEERDLITAGLPLEQQVGPFHHTTPAEQGSSVSQFGHRTAVLPSMEQQAKLVIVTPPPDELLTDASESSMGEGGPAAVGLPTKRQPKRATRATPAGRNVTKQVRGVYNKGSKRMLWSLGEEQRLRAMVEAGKCWNEIGKVRPRL